jgi:endonuclease IV
MDDFPVGCVQFFTHGPRNKQETKLNYNKLKNISKEINIYVHSSYPTGWNSPKHVYEQLDVCDKIGSSGLVIHLPKNTPKFICPKVKEWLEHKAKTKILLEVRSIRPCENKSYETPEKIINLIETLKKYGITSENVGIVIDTAHIYIGYAPIREYKETNNFLNKFNDYKEWFPLLHLNGNMYDAKVRAGDKHIIPLDDEDKIWNNIRYEDSGCFAFIEWFLNNDSDIILEVPHNIQKNRDGLSFLLETVQRY